MSERVGPKLNGSFVCLACRKGFRCRRRSQLLRGYRLPRNEPRIPCPDCGASIRDFGPSFHAPRRRDLRSWTAIRTHITRGREPGYLYRSEGYRLLKEIEARHLPGKGRRAGERRCW